MLSYAKLIFLLLISRTVKISGALLTNVIDPIKEAIPGTENSVLCTLNTPDIIDYYGYESETQQVTTVDGYIITVHCLSNSTARNATLNPVIAWHGLSDASHTFCLNSPGQSLAFLLADSPYWRFSWDEIAEFDVPAVIYDVLLRTGKSQVIYIGHSQGATTMFALLSSQPSYNAKLSVFIALAPVVFFTHTTSPPFVAASNNLLMLQSLYGAEFFPHTILQTMLTFSACKLAPALCNYVLSYLYGYSTHTNEDRLPVFICRTPTDHAWGQFLQYAQHVNVNAFQKYDFKLGNYAKYGQSSPPQYDLTKVTAPVALFHSDADLTTPNVDVQKLISILGDNVVFEQRVKSSFNFNHVDYVWGKDVREIVYSEIFRLLKS